MLKSRSLAHPDRAEVNDGLEEVASIETVNFEPSVGIAGEQVIKTYDSFVHEMAI
jgi:hypothetical protein